MSAVSESVEAICIAAGAAINPDILLGDIRRIEDAGFSVADRLVIDQSAAVITPGDIEAEGEATKHIASTMQGTGQARSRRLMRGADVKLARDVGALKSWIGNVPRLLNAMMNDGRGVLVEGAQGVDLDLYHGYRYPFVTSHGCTPMQVIQDAGIAPQMVTRSVMVVRSFPIRVGHVVEEGARVGDSGPLGGRETTFERIAASAGLEEGLQEVTTTTKRPRRVFEFDFERIGLVSMMTRPTDIALTFADYLDANVAGWNTDLMYRNGGDMKAQVVWPSTVSGHIHSVQKACARGTAAPRIRLVKTGPRDSDMVDTMPGW